MIRRTFACFAVLVGTVVAAAPAARAVDHDNLDAGRPLRVGDADAIAFGERSFEFGASVARPRGRRTGLGFSAEYLYGFALNSHVSLDFDPTVGARAGSSRMGFDAGDVRIGLFHNFNREYGNTPAFALQGDVLLPTGRGSRGVGFRLRGLLSRTASQYGRLHVNVDATLVTHPQAGERAIRPALVVGYSAPLGYPNRFDRTGLVEIAVRGGERNGSSAVASAGIGLRQQVSVRSVVDVGLQGDFAGGRGAARDDLRLVGGYSTAF